MIIWPKFRVGRIETMTIGKVNPTIRLDFATVDTIDERTVGPLLVLSEFFEESVRYLY